MADGVSELLGPWLRAFVLTQVVEVPIYRLAAAARLPYALAASALTHPFVWFFFPWLAERLAWSWGTMAVAAELFAWLVEAAWLGLAARVRWPRALFASLVANGASAGVGLALRALWGIV